MTKRAQSVFCVGVQKAGTSSLFELFANHPQVATHGDKESAFFYRKNLLARGFLFYTNLFLKNKETLVNFDCDPNFIIYPEALKRIKLYDKNAKIIVLLRNPSDRSRSQYAMMKKYGYEFLKYKDAISVEANRIKINQYSYETYNYFQRSDYVYQIKRLLEIFPREQILFILFEEFIKDQEKEFMKITKWCGLNWDDNFRKAFVKDPMEKIGRNVYPSKIYRILKYAISFRFDAVISLLVTCFLLIVNSRNSPQSVNQSCANFDDIDFIKIEELTGLSLDSWKSNSSTS